MSLSEVSDPDSGKLFINGNDIGILIDLNNNSMLGSANSSEYQNIIENICEKFLLKRIKPEENLPRYLKIKKEDENIVCAICCCELEEGLYKRTLLCDHTFHKKCIDRWIKIGKHTCPSCRINVYNKNV
jgi:hypothetical protein